MLSSLVTCIAVLGAAPAEPLATVTLSFPAPQEKTVCTEDLRMKARAWVTDRLIAVSAGSLDRESFLARTLAAEAGLPEAEFTALTRSAPGTPPLSVLRTRLGEQEVNAAFASLRRKLWDAYSPTLAPRSKVSIPPGGSTLGAVKPSLDLVLFVEDPAASNHFEAAVAALNRSPQKVRLSMRPVAFRGPPSARQVGLACAAVLGKLPEYVRFLPPALDVFGPRKGPAERTPEQVAAAAGLDGSAFAKCLETNAGRRVLEENTKVATELGLGPARSRVLFINGSGLCANITDSELQALVAEDPF